MTPSFFVGEVTLHHGSVIFVFVALSMFDFSGDDRVVNFFHEVTSKLWRIEGSKVL